MVRWSTLRLMLDVDMHRGRNLEVGHNVGTKIGSSDYVTHDALVVGMLSEVSMSHVKW